MAAPLPGQSSTEAFELGGWSFEARITPIWGTDRLEEVARANNLCEVPDMFCGDAGITFTHFASGTRLELIAMDALRCLVFRPPPHGLQPAPWETDTEGPLLGAVKCQFASKWRPQNDNPDVKEIDVLSDWTCSSSYWGSWLEGEGSCLSEQETSEGLPFDLLRQRDEIKWYQEVLFWEDELSDNGFCRASVRVRVMPSFWFALLTCELRVDGVLIREVATRLFCSFNSNEVLREWTWREASYKTLRGRGVQFADNPHISQVNVGTSLLSDADVRQRYRHAIRIASADTGIRDASADGGAGSGEND